MASPWTLLSDHASDWSWATCCEPYKAAKYWPWRSPDAALVCEHCIKQQFEQALACDLHWPARWGPHVLDVHDFEQVLHPVLIPRYLRRGEELARHRATAAADRAGIEGLVLGRDYQFCPTCKNAVGLEDGCNRVVCKCGASFCFVCGLVAFDDGGGHWREGGCPRYNAVGSGEEEYHRDSDAMDISSGNEIEWIT